MGNIIEHLDNILKEEVKKAKEIYIAVALANDYAISILEQTKKNCNIKIVIGIDLPTPIKVLKNLKQMYSNNVRIYLRKEFFHPKLYIFRYNDDSIKAYLGSGNFTNGGLYNNIELFSLISDRNDCNYLLNWFNDIFNNSDIISSPFLTNYAEYCNKWHNTHIDFESKAKDIKNNQENLSADTDKLIGVLKKMKNRGDYTSICKSKIKAIKNIRHSIDYDNNFKNIDINAFFSIDDLGKLDRRNFEKLTKYVNDGSLHNLFTMLCNNNIPLNERYRLALNEYKVPYCGQNVCTKILVAHDPENTMLWNAALDYFIKEFHFKFERGTPIGDKYEELCKYFKNICNIVGIVNFAVLDEYLYKAMLESKYN